MKKVTVHTSETVHYLATFEVPDEYTEDHVMDEYILFGCSKDTQSDSSGWQVDRIEMTRL